MGATPSKGLQQYMEQLDWLLWLRALDAVSDDDEERYAVALHDCRAGMTPDEEARIDELVASRRAIQAQPELLLKDTMPENSLGPPREAA